MSARVEGDRVVVTGSSAGSHFPRKQAEIQQRFEANGGGAEGPFLIEGSVYGRDVRFRGAGVVCGPLLGRGDVTIEPAEGRGPARFLGGLHASGNIVSTPRRGGFGGSLLASIEQASRVVRGDVIAEQVSLSDAVVFGNVRARRVKLSRCIVLGQVVARESAVFHASTLVSYEAGEVRFEGPCAIVFPAGTSVGVPVFAPATDDLGTELRCEIAFLPVLRAFGSRSLVYRPAPAPGTSWAPARWLPTATETAPNQVSGAMLHAVDWVRADVESRVRKVRDGKIEEATVPAERYVLSVAGRALDFSSIVPSLEHATFMLRTALEFEHYSPPVQEATHQAWTARCTAEERQLLRWATSREQLAPPAPRPAMTRPPALPAAETSHIARGAVAPQGPPRPAAPASASPTPSARTYEVTNDGVTVAGPASATQIRGAVAAGKLNSASRIRPTGKTEWRPIGDLDALEKSSSST